MEVLGGCAAAAAAFFQKKAFGARRDTIDMRGHLLCAVILFKDSSIFMLRYQV